MDPVSVDTDEISSTRKYIEEVKDGVFPAEEHSFKISDEVIEKLY